MRNGEKILGGGGEMERVQTTIRLPAELKDQIQREADREGQITEDYFVGFWVKYPLKTIG